MQLETQTQNPIHETAPNGLTPLNIIRTETILSKLPVHNLAKKGRVDIQITKLGPTGAVELKWEVSYSERYGQARQLAYKLDTLVVDEHIDESGRPLPERICLGSLNQIAQELGLIPDHGTTNQNLKKAFRQNALAGITAKFKYKTNDGNERTLEATFTRYSVIFTGEKFSDGTKADAVYIELNPTYREVLNNAPIRPLNLDYKKALAPGPQRFYEIFSYKIFTALKYKHPMARLAYSEYCTCSAQQRYFDYDHFKKQMYKIHRPHLKSSYITKVEFDQITDEQGRVDWMMRYIPGPKARAEYNAFTSGKKLQTIDVPPAQEEKNIRRIGPTTQPNHPRQKPLNLQPEVDQDLLSALTSRGISALKSKQLILKLAPDQPLLDQIEYAEHLIAKAPKDSFYNPAGFLIQFIANNEPVPDTFEPSSKKRLRQQQEADAARLRLEEQQLEEAYDAYKRSETNAYIQTLPAREFERLIEAQKAAWKKGSSKNALFPDATVTQIAINAVRAELSKNITIMGFEDFCGQQRSKGQGSFTLPDLAIKLLIPGRT